ncbi:MAG: chlorite dismutase family protein [Chloroflexi bacterium]|nr:chlorite dismutase family protein [Chloroflexota bacterium]
MTASNRQADGPPEGAGRPEANGQQTEGTPRRQFVKFSFFKMDPAWRRLPTEDREQGKQEVCQVVESFGNRMLIGSYSLVGIRGDSDFLLWQVSAGLEEFNELGTALFSTAMGSYLDTPYSYLAMTRRSIYKTPDLTEPSESRLSVSPGTAKYLFVYPFVKTRPWYELSKDTRQEMMNEHIGVGRKYPSVKLNTTYSYGIDDQEFVVSFETDNPADFLDLVMELRDSKASAYTLRDTPTFTCLAMPLPKVLDSLGAQGGATLAEALGSASTTDGWTSVANIDDLPDGTSTVVHVGGEQVALFNVGGTLYAIGNRCSHANGPLADGKVEGRTVTCPYHNSKFDLATGEPLQEPAQQAVPTYQVKVEIGSILIARQPVESVS